MKVEQAESETLLPYRLDVFDYSLLHVYILSRSISIKNLSLIGIIFRCNQCGSTLQGIDPSGNPRPVPGSCIPHLSAKP